MYSHMHQLSLQAHFDNQYADSIRTGDYKFTEKMPKVVIVNKPYVEKRKRFWTRKEYDVEIPQTVCYLEFDRELTEAELNMWRMFKIGFFAGIKRCHYIDPE